MSASEPANTQELTAQEERAKYGEEKPRAKDTARLIWASKPKKEPNAKELEFQTAEEVYPNVAEAKKRTLSNFMVESREISAQPNRLIWGDNLLVMQALLAQGYEGQVDLIYIDPPFNTGENFNFSHQVKIGNETFEKELPVNERLAYTDTWDRGIDSFLDMLYPRLQLMRKLLSDDGSIFVHCDWNASNYIRVLLDEIFTRANFRNEIAWRCSSGARGVSGGQNQLVRTKHSIFFYSKTPNKNKFEVQFRDYSEKTIALYKHDDGDGRGKYRLQMLRNYSEKSIEDFAKDGRIFVDEDGKKHLKQYLSDKEGVALDDIWTDIYAVQKVATENTDYPTQKPESLMERIISISTKKGDLVADFFCGSGTTAAVAEKMERRWITSDVSKTGIQVARGRLVNNGAKPFVIQNLGNYQRQLIYSKEVKLKEMYDIVLKLYGATPRDDTQGFGISKEDRSTLVYVCEPDRPMTGKKAYDLARMAKSADGKGYRNLVILAWDYDYDFDDAFDKLAKDKKMYAEVDFKVIPSDVYKYLRSSKAGDSDLANKINFYQKPYLKLSEPQVIDRSGNEVRVKLKIDQYVVMDIPIKDESKRPEIERELQKNFANLIDYWTVDWDYDGEVFKSKWQAMRERKSAEPVPVVAESMLAKGKKYKIAVRVVDVFGNDASMTKEIDLG